MSNNTYIIIFSCKRIGEKLTLFTMRCQTIHIIIFSCKKIGEKYDNGRKCHELSLGPSRNMANEILEGTSN